MKPMDDLLVFLPDSADGVAVQIYARHMLDLLGRQISYLPIGPEDDVARIKHCGVQGCRNRKMV
jgi:hypothetical protein